MPHSFIQLFTPSFLPSFIQLHHIHTPPQNNSTIHNPHTSQPNDPDSSPNSSPSTQTCNTQHVIQNMQWGERKFCEACVIHRALSTLRQHKNLAERVWKWLSIGDAAAMIIYPYPSSTQAVLGAVKDRLRPIWLPNRFHKWPQALNLWCGDGTRSYLLPNPAQTPPQPRNCAQEMWLLSYGGWSFPGEEEKRSWSTTAATVYTRWLPLLGTGPSRRPILSILHYKQKELPTSLPCGIAFKPSGLLCWKHNWN